METFFENKGPYYLDYLLSNISLTSKDKKYKNIKINNISSLNEATKNDICFFHDLKYLNELNKTEASNVLIREKHLSLIENIKFQPIISQNPLNDFILIANIFYPDANFDDNELMLEGKYKSFLSKSTVIDDRVKFSKNFKIGANSTIKKNVIIGDNVSIGSNCVISNSIIDNNVVINDGTVIGKIGFGFKFINNKIISIPHIGSVKIGKSVYIGSNCTIDRGSFSNTVIGDGTRIDNQVHIAHNCKIGDNCFIAGQVGIAGSTKIGNNCMIGGQAGISGHLKVGDNVYIGGGSGVLNDIENKKKIMGYPAKSMKEFIKIKKNDQ